MILLYFHTYSILPSIFLPYLFSIYFFQSLCSVGVLLSTFVYTHNLLASNLPELWICDNNPIMHANLFLFSPLVVHLLKPEGGEEKERPVCDGEWWWHGALPGSLFTALSTTSGEPEHYIACNTSLSLLRYTCTHTFVYYNTF